jgi:hypothetical protein
MRSLAAFACSLALDFLIQYGKSLGFYSFVDTFWHSCYVMITRSIPAADGQESLQWRCTTPATRLAAFFSYSHDATDYARECTMRQIILGGYLFGHFQEPL